MLEIYIEAKNEIIKNNLKKVEQLLSSNQGLLEYADTDGVTLAGFAAALKQRDAIFLDAARDGYHNIITLLLPKVSSETQNTALQMATVHNHPQIITKIIKHQNLANPELFLEHAFIVLDPTSVMGRILWAPEKPKSVPAYGVGRAMVAIAKTSNTPANLNTGNLGEIFQLVNKHIENAVTTYNVEAMSDLKKRLESLNKAIKSSAKQSAVAAKVNAHNEIEKRINKLNEAIIATKKIVQVSASLISKQTYPVLSSDLASSSSSSSSRSQYPTLDIPIVETEYLFTQQHRNMTSEPVNTLAYREQVLRTQAAIGNIDGVALELEDGIEIKLFQETNDSALSMAVKYGHHEVVKLLLQYMPDLEVIKHALQFTTDPEIQSQLNAYLEQYKDCEKSSSLHLAVMSGNIKLITLRMNERNINLPDANELTPLDLAAYNNRMDIAALLLNRGANPLVVNQFGRTPFHLACRAGKVDFIRELISRSVFAVMNKEQRDRAVYESAVNGHMEIASLLVSYGGNIDAKSNKENTALIVLAKGKLNPTAIEHATVLLDLGADPTLAGEGGKSALYYAIIKNNQPLVELLLSYATNVEGVKKAFDDAKKTINAAFKKACEAFNPTCKDEIYLSIPIEDKVNRFIKDNKKFTGYSPLSFAAATGNYRLFRQILTRDTNKKFKDSEIKALIAIALDNGWPSVAQEIFLHFSLSYSTHDNLKLLLKNTFSVRFLFLVLAHSKPLVREVLPSLFSMLDLTDNELERISSVIEYYFDKSIEKSSDKQKAAIKDSLRFTLLTFFKDYNGIIPNAFLSVLARSKKHIIETIAEIKDNMKSIDCLLSCLNPNENLGRIVWTARGSSSASFSSGQLKEVRQLLLKKMEIVLNGTHDIESCISLFDKINKADKVLDITFNSVLYPDENSVIIADMNKIKDMIRVKMQEINTQKSSESISLIQTKPGDKSSAEQSAVASNPKEVAQLYPVIKNAIANQNYAFGNTELHGLVISRNIEQLRLALATGQHNIEARNASRKTALDFAVVFGNVEAVEELLTHGAKIELDTETGESPLSLAAKCGSKRMVATLLAHYPDIELVQQASRCAQSDEIKTVLEGHIGTIVEAPFKNVEYNNANVTTLMDKKGKQPMRLDEDNDSETLPNNTKAADNAEEFDEDQYFECLESDSEADGEADEKEEYDEDQFFDCLESDSETDSKKNESAEYEFPRVPTKTLFPVGLNVNTNFHNKANVNDIRRSNDPKNRQSLRA